MEEEQAKALAELIGGQPWDSGGGIWLVCRERRDGKVVAISDEIIAEYPDWNELEAGRPVRSIVFI